MLTFFLHLVCQDDFYFIWEENVSLRAYCTILISLITVSEYTPCSRNVFFLSSHVKKIVAGSVFHVRF